MVKRQNISEWFDMQKDFIFILLGLIVGILASFTGLGGGFLMVPLLLFLGYDAQKSVGTSFMAIVVISISALFAHSKLKNVDYRVGILLGIGGIIGAQIGARLLEHVPTDTFKKIFAIILFLLALRMFLKR
ncbi:MAG: sulfite exporter TauE/SafE family protein [Candidatus Desulfofervidaceae bacterium]|nr:sulfite exporter TauE/SafE family protein [Candidatus Desulfofervidaceae bacterium]